MDSCSYSALVLLHTKLASAERRRWNTFRRKFIHNELLSKGKLVCFYCGQDDLVEKGPKKKLATLDHVVPRAKNGKDVDNNMVVCCDACNRKKSNLPFDVFVGSKYLKEKRNRNENPRHS